MRESPPKPASVASGGNTSPQQAGIGRAALTVAAFTLTSIALWAWAFEQRGRGAIHDYKFLLWGVLVLGLGVTSGGVFEFGLRQQVRIDAIPRAHSEDGPHVAWGPVVWLAVGISCAVALLASGNFAIGQSAGTVRAVALTILAIVGGTPAIVALLGIREVILITGGREPWVDASRLHAYLELRAMATGLLRGLGALVALTLFAAGAARQALPPGAHGIEPPGVVIAFGVIGTTLVGVIYAVPGQALRREARALMRLLAPPRGTEPAELRAELDARENLERQLGLNASLFGDLQSAIVVAAPLIAASVTLFLPSR